MWRHFVLDRLADCWPQNSWLSAGSTPDISVKGAVYAGFERVLRYAYTLTHTVDPPCLALFAPA